MLYLRTIKSCINEPIAPLLSSEAISPQYIGDTVITKPTPNPCNNLAAYICPILDDVANKTKATMKKVALEISVHLRPILSANGPAAYGAEMIYFFISSFYYHMKFQRERQSWLFS